MVATWVGHATWLVQSNGLNILTDPIWSDTSGPFGIGPHRVAEPGIRFEDLPRIDVVLVSHQLPIWMVHRALAHERLAHDPRKRRCDLSSISTLCWHGDHFAETGYVSPALALLDPSNDVGAV